MNDTVINFKTDAKTKRAAQKLADEFGVSLSSLITMTLRNVVRTKRLGISLIPEVSATKDEIRVIKEGLAEYRSGKTVPLRSL